MQQKEKKSKNITIQSVCGSQFTSLLVHSQEQLLISGVFRCYIYLHKNTHSSAGEDRVDCH